MQPVQPEITEYIDTTLIECSRKQSIQLDDVNRTNEDTSNALFTNRQSYGIQIEEGDKISLNSAYVSEVGAGSDVIEFTGLPNGETYEVEYTNTSYTNPITVAESEVFNPFNSSGSASTGGEFEIPYYGNNLVDFKDENTSNIKKTFNIVDNEINFSVSYYKNTNGENYFHLPRRFASGIDYNDIQSLYENIASNDLAPKIIDHYSKSWGGTVTGQTVNTVVDWDGIGHIQNIPTYSQRCKDDWQIISGDYGSVDGSSGGTAEKGEPPIYKRKNGNERYKIFRRKKTKWYPEALETVYYKSYLFPRHDIAYEDYIEYKELKTLKSDVGFDTPSNIATNLTEQLSQVGEPNPINLLVSNYNDRYSGSLPNPKRPTELQVATRNESTMLKPFRAATLTSFNKTNSRRLMAGVNKDGSASGIENLAYSQSTLDFYNSFQNIGVKRPDLFTNGRKLNRNIKTQTSININASDTSDIVLNIEWEEINAVTGNIYLNDIADFIHSQELYPELFDYSYTENTPNSSYVGIDKSRFIHIATKYPPSNELGTDNWLLPGDTSMPSSGALSGSASSPLWIGYTPSQKNHRNFTIDGDNPTNTWGGFAHKYTDHTTKKQYIALNCSSTQSLVNTPDLFNVSSIGMGRPLGFDWHFSAYGTSCIGLYNGNTTFGWFDSFETAHNSASSVGFAKRVNLQQQFDLSSNVILLYDKAPFVYLGSPAPLINFDTAISRFTISGLHSPEYIGNQQGTGGWWTTAPEKAVKPDQEVYYINKRLKHNTFCPEMIPYQWSRKYSDDTAKPYSMPMNTNIIPHIEYDTNSGILWNTFGSDRKNWNNNSLLGILGFDYNSLNPETFTNINTRYPETTNLPGTKGITTNARVIPIDILSRSQNAFGFPVYNNTVPVAMQPGYFIDVNINRGRALNSLDYSYNHPTIVRDTVSSIIRATGLPKKTTRPYYLIRSNIITQNNFMDGTGAILPVIGLVDKKNGDADYYTTDGGGVEFTATHPFVITQITTSIHAPNGSLATVNENSAVIYKIQKNKKITTNLSDVVMSQIPPSTQK